MTVLATTRVLGTAVHCPIISVLLCGSLLAFSVTAHAQGVGSPDACQAYSGEAHVQCLHIYIEMQEKRIAQMEEAQHRQVGRVDHGEVLTDDMRAAPRDSQPPLTIPPADPVYLYPPVAPGYAYAGYGYPGVPFAYPAYGAAFGLSLFPGLGLSLGFGGPGYYGRPFYSLRYMYRSPGFFRPRFSYGPRIYSGPRFYPGPGYYSGPHSFGHRSFGHHHR